jgi:hypothetical protein
MFTLHGCVWQRSPYNYLISAWGVQGAAVDQQLMARDEFLTDIRGCLIQSQVTMKEYQDQKMTGSVVSGR